MQLLEYGQYVAVVLGARAVERIARAKTDLLYNPILGAHSRAVASRVSDDVTPL